MLAIAVLFTSGLMAANEVPELLTLTDNVSNDYELGWQRLPGRSVQDVTRDTTAVSSCSLTLSSYPDLALSFTSTSPLKQISPLFLSMLVVQRK